MRVWLSIILPLLFAGQLRAQFDMLPATDPPVLRQTAANFQMCPQEELLNNKPVRMVLCPDGNCPKPRQPVTDNRPLLIAYNPTSCAPCIAKVQAVKDANFFNVKDVRENVPDWVKQIGEARGYPVYHWETPSGYVSDTHHSVETLIERYKNSQIVKPTTAVPAAPTTPIATYPANRPRWNVEGDWNPSKAKVISHLLSHSNHRGKYNRAWLEQLSLAQLRTLHDDDHDNRASRILLPAARVPQPARLNSTGCPTCPR